MLENRAGHWISHDQWELPPEDSTGAIRNVDTGMVLGIDGLHVLEEIWDESPEQIWKIGKSDTSGYFTITNQASGKPLTAPAAFYLSIPEGIWDICVRNCSMKCSSMC